MSRAIVFWVVMLFVAGKTLAQPGEQDVASAWTGRWEGVLTQKEGGFVPEYRMVMVLSVSGNQVSGFSEVWYGETIYVKSEVRGKLTRGFFLDLKDGHVLNRKEIEDFDYCRKSFQLVLKRKGEGFILTGRWQGQTDQGPCVPGTVSLERKSARV